MRRLRYIAHQGAELSDLYIYYYTHSSLCLSAARVCDWIYSIVPKRVAMKKLTLTLSAAFLLAVTSLLAQDNIQYPRFPGCADEHTIAAADCAEMKMMQFIFSNLRHPDEAKKAGVTGEIEVKFTVTLAGEIKSPTITKGLGHGCDEEVLRIIGMMPKWMPGKEAGTAKEMEAYIYVTFK